MASNEIKEELILADISKGRGHWVHGRESMAGRLQNWELCAGAQLTHTCFSFLQIHFILFYFIFMCVGCLYGCVCTCIRYPQRPEEGVISGVGITAVSHLIWVLGTELWSFGRTASALNHWAVSAASAFSFLFSPEPQPHGWCYPHSGWVFPLQLSRSGNPVIDKAWALFP